MCLENNYKNHLDVIDWYSLAQNPNAINILIKNLNLIEWRYLCCNYNIHQIICKLNYQKMREKNMNFFQELCEYVYNPIRLIRLSKIYNIDFIDLLNIY